MATASFPPVLPHGELVELFPGISFVAGGLRMAPLVSFSRNMVVVREGERLVLINSLRLDDAGLAALDALGRVTDVIRLAGFHGRDDPFYKDRYDAKVWVVEGMRYFRGFDPRKTPESYFEPDATLGSDSALPLAGATLYAFGTRTPEALLRLPHAGGILVSGDCLQNWARPDRYFSFVGSLMMRAMGFIKPYNLGPGWIKATKPKAAEIRGILDLEFEHVLPAHGEPVVGGAKEKFRPVLEAYFGGPS
jgi:hypothetical protein